MVALKEKYREISLDHRDISQHEKKLREYFSYYIHGQEYAVNKIVSRILGLNNRTGSEEPAMTTLLLGSEGTGTEEIIRTVARYIYDDPGAYTKIVCSSPLRPNLLDQVFLNFFLQQKLEAIKLKEFEAEKLNEQLQIYMEDLFYVNNDLTEAETRGKKKKIEELKEEKDELDVLFLITHEEREKVRADVDILKRQLPFGERSPTIVVFEGIDSANLETQSIIADIVRTGKALLYDGYTVDFSNCIVFLTCDHFSKNLANSLKKIGFNSSGDKAKTRSSYEKAKEKIFQSIPLKILSAVGKENIIALKEITKESVRKEIGRLLNNIKTMAVNGLPTHFIWGKKFFDFLVNEASDTFNRKIGLASAKRVVVHRTKEVIERLIRNGREGNPNGIVGGETIRLDINEKGEVTTSRIEKIVEKKEPETIQIQDHTSFCTDKGEMIFLPPPKNIGLI